MGLFNKILRTGEGKMLRSLQSLVPDVNAFEPEIEAKSDDDLRHCTVRLRERLDRGETLDDVLVEAFAVVREASRRVIGQRHYDVQLMGGAALHFGWVAEMKTGEGKTLVSTLPVYLNGLSGRGLHVVTVNDYLARRDAEWMGQIHNWLGLTVGLIVPGNDSEEYKRSQYACDVTYGTNNEFGFDYLRDNMAMAKAEQVQRGHVYAIVDEIDSILIDEARTPLIISGRVSDAAESYVRFAQVVRQLRRDTDYEVDDEKRTIFATEIGIDKVEKMLGLENLYDVTQTNLVHQLNVALKAKELFHRDKDYIVDGGEVKIVDENTGRTLDGRRWSEGIHQAVEAKEGVKIKEENQTLATVTLQNFFRMYDKLAGMTGTAQTEASELANTYGLQVVPIPTNKPGLRADQHDLIYKAEEAKFDAVVDDIVGRYEIGQPVLAGTASVEHSERLSGLLGKRGVKHEVLNAKQHARESEIIAQAGRLGAVTVATNMAGRGVDILLGGNAELLALRDLRDEGVPASTADEIRRRVIETERRLEMVSSQGGGPEIIEALQSDLETAVAQRDRFDGLFADYEPECKEEGAKVRKLGGLYVLGTERHESRRIDNQLRGRSGRQGDLGESRFYISLEDELMRLFATGTMERVMSAAFPDDVPIESKMVSKAVERAQTTVEQKNAEIRKNVLKYDEVMNEQRKVVYSLRNQILDERPLRDRFLASLAEAVDGFVEVHCSSAAPDEWDFPALLTEVSGYWPTQITAEDMVGYSSTDAVYEHLMGEATGIYEAKEKAYGEEIMRAVERQIMLQLLDQRWREHLYEMDYLREGIGLRAMGQRDPLTEWQREGFDMFAQMMTAANHDFVRYLLHAEIELNEQAPAPGPDLAAVQAALDDFAAAQGAKTDPEPTETRTAVVPHAEAARVTNVAYTSSENASVDVLHGGVAPATGRLSQAEMTANALAGAQTGPVMSPVVKPDSEKIGRNDRCHCGSGKKFKACHGKAQAAAGAAQ